VGGIVGITSFAYRLVFLLHILSAIIGFGGVILSGVYAARARKLPPGEALAIMETNTFVAEKVAQIFIYLTAVWGLGLVGLSDEVFTFGQTWVWVSIVLFVIAVGISHGVMRPRVHRMLELLRAIATRGAPAGGPPPEAKEMGAIGQQIGATGVVLDVFLVALLVLMIWKPGF
jgi:uncharacterized membrane protein